MRWWLKRRELERLVLVPYRPLRKLSLSVGAVILLVVGCVGSYYMGRFGWLDRSQAVSSDAVFLSQKVQRLERDRSALQEQVGLLRQELEMQSRTTAAMREDNKETYATMAKLSTEAALYKSLLSPKARQEGLSVERFSLTPMSEKRFRYSLLLTHFARDRKQMAEVSGNLSVRVSGRRDGQRMTLQPAVPGGQQAFRLQYYQDLSGELVLPEGFIPDAIELLITRQGVAPVRKSFLWQVATPA